MFGNFPGNERQPLGQRVRFLAAVGFDVADDDVAPVLQFALRRLEHGVGFADARAHAEKNLEPAALFLGGFALKRGQQGVGIGALAVVHKFTLTKPTPNSASKLPASPP